MADRNQHRANGLTQGEKNSYGLNIGLLLETVLQLKISTLLPFILRSISPNVPLPQCERAGGGGEGGEKMSLPG